jgi:hypothetical protein
MLVSWSFFQLCHFNCCLLPHSSQHTSGCARMHVQMISHAWFAPLLSVVVQALCLMLGDKHACLCTCLPHAGDGVPRTDMAPGSSSGAVVQPSSNAAAAACSGSAPGTVRLPAGAPGSSREAAGTAAAFAAVATDSSSNSARGRRAAAAGVARLVQAEMRNTNMLAMQAAADGSWRQGTRPPAQATAGPVAQTAVQESLVQATVRCGVTRAVCKIIGCADIDGLTCSVHTCL